MTEPTQHTGDSRSTGDDDPWRSFQKSLTSYLSTIGSTDDHLVIELPGEDPTGSLPYAQFAGFGEPDDPQVRAEVTGNSFLADGQRLSDERCARLTRMGWRQNLSEDGEQLNWSLELPVGAARTLARRTICALRDVYGIPHPGLLTYSAWGPAADRGAALDLEPTEAVILESPVREAPLAFRAKDAEQLRSLVGEALSARCGEEVEADDDGDFLMHHDGFPYWVRVCDDAPVIQVFSLVTTEVRSRRRAAVELGILNRDHLWVRWVLRDRQVHQLMAVPGQPFAPDHLDHLLDAYEAGLGVRDDLELRLG